MKITEYVSLKVPGRRRREQWQHRSSASPATRRRCPLGIVTTVVSAFAMISFVGLVSPVVRARGKNY